MDNWIWGLIGFFALVLVIAFFVILNFMGLYVRAYFSGARLGFRDLIGMRLRRINSNLIVNSRIQATKAGLQITQDEMETHYLAGGDVQRVIAAMIAANKASIDLQWKTATAIDLA